MSEQLAKSEAQLKARVDRVLGSSKFPGPPMGSQAGADRDDEEEDDNDTDIDGRLKLFDQMKEERG